MAKISKAVCAHIPCTEEMQEAIERLDILSGNDVWNDFAKTFFDDEEEDCSDYVWGIFQKGHLIGYCTVGGADCEKDLEKYSNDIVEDKILSNVYIEPQYRGKGHGLNLVKNVCREIVGKNKCNIFLYYIEDSIQEFYHKAGFVALENTNVMMLQK